MRLLPVPVYWESLTTSLREIRNNLRVVVLTSTVLVLATAAAVAAAAHAIGLQWGPAWVLGAALAPTDATAVGVLARKLPRRTVTVLRAESLVNDGTALVIYGLAVGVTVGEEQLTPLHVSGLLVLAYGGGLLTGALTGLLSWQLRRRIDDPMLENIAMLVTPFAAFLLAAAAVCGAVRPAPGRQLRHRGTPIRPTVHHRRRDRRDPCHRGRAGHRQARGRAGAHRDRETAEGAGSRRRRR